MSDVEMAIGAPSTRPELVLGLVAPLGTPLSQVSDLLSTRLNEVAGYDSEVIKLSGLLGSVGGLETTLSVAPEQDRYETHMDAGDELREKVGNDAMARLALTRLREYRREVPREDLDEYRARLLIGFADEVDPEAIRQLPGFIEFLDEDAREASFEAEAALREQLSAVLQVPLVSIQFDQEPDSSSEIVPELAWILHSLKHPDEADLLRRVYGSRFVLLGVYSSRGERARRLSAQFAKSIADFDTDRYLPEAYEFIRRDIDDLAREHGQKTRDAFWLSDFFMALGDDYPPLQLQVDRIVRLLFGDTFITPRKEEVAMMHAAVVARRSASMARQVGATLARDDGTIVATGCNDVPRPGGGQYWEGEEPDYRDFTWSTDISDELRFRLLADLLRRLDDCNWLADDRAANVRDDLDRAVRDLAGNVLRLDPEASVGTEQPARSRVLSLIEYTRSVHAEMAAITDASRHGLGVAGSNLYTTTYPCHECTRHIVASGIKSVTYVEPYPKSLAEELSGHAISVEDDEGGDRVRFLPFVGVAPSRFLDLFEAGERKDEDGKRLKTDLTVRMPKVDSADLDARFATEKEAQAVNQFREKMERYQLTWLPEGE